MKFITLAIISVALASCAGVQTSYDLSWEEERDLYQLGVTLRPEEVPSTYIPPYIPLNK